MWLPPDRDLPFTPSSHFHPPPPSSSLPFLITILHFKLFVYCVHLAQIRQVRFFSNFKNCGNFATPTLDQIFREAQPGELPPSFPPPPGYTPMLAKLAFCQSIYFPWGGRAYINLRVTSRPYFVCYHTQVIVRCIGRKKIRMGLHHTSFGLALFQIDKGFYKIRKRLFF